MYKFAVCFLVYMAVLAMGVMPLKRKGRKKEIVLFVGLIGWCMYLSIAHIWNLPIASLANLQFWIYAPAGRWLERVLGGIEGFDS